MKNILTFLFSFLVSAVYSQVPDSTVYELRIYKTTEDKRDLLVHLLQNELGKMLKGHDMKRYGFWSDADSSKVIFIMVYKNKVAMAKAWKEFYDDPLWPPINEKLNSDAKVVLGITSIFMRGAGVLRKLKSKDVAAPLRFELRIGTALPNRLPNLVARFRDKANKMLAKYDINGIAYWTTIEATGIQPRIVYILTYTDKESQIVNWKKFNTDTEWIRYKDESEKDGKMVKNVEIIYMSPISN